jgi:Flp pilus assembly protein TadG
MGAGILEFAAGVCGFVGLTALTFAVTGIITQRKVVRQQASAVNRG